MKIILQKTRKLLKNLFGIRFYNRQYNYYEPVFSQYNDFNFNSSLYDKYPSNNYQDTNIETFFTDSLKYGNILKDENEEIPRSLTYYTDF